MYQFQAYDLAIASELELPEFAKSEEIGGNADVVIRFGTVEKDNLSKDHGVTQTLTEMGEHFYWDIVGSFIVRDGAEIVIDPKDRANVELLRLPLLGPVFGALLRQRGLLVLHGSAVAVHGSAIAFVGPKGAGKSTLAANFHKQGHQLIADDIVALKNLDSEQIMVVPGSPRFKLYPDTVTALGENPVHLPRLWTAVEKRWRSAGDRFWGRPLQLRHLYVLQEAPTVEIEPLPHSDALFHLMGNAYLPFADEPRRRRYGPVHFQQCAQLLEKVPVSLLKRPLLHQHHAQVRRLVEEMCS